MPDARRKNCVRCGRHTTECGPISWQGYCLPCGLAAMTSAEMSIANKSGAAHIKRMRGYAKMLARESLDDKAPAA